MEWTELMPDLCPSPVCRGGLAGVVPTRRNSSGREPSAVRGGSAGGLGVAGTWELIQVRI